MVKAVLPLARKFQQLVIGGIRNYGECRRDIRLVPQPIVQGYLQTDSLIVPEATPCAVFKTLAFGQAGLSLVFYASVICAPAPFQAVPNGRLFAGAWVWRLVKKISGPAVGKILVAGLPSQVGPAIER